jgi:hypothetical protein
MNRRFPSDFFRWQKEQTESQFSLGPDELEDTEAIDHGMGGTLASLRL